MIPAANISDALDMMGLDGQISRINALVPGAVCCGPAFTVRFAPATEVRSAPAANYIDRVPAGSVIVLDNDGRSDHTVWGGILSTIAASRKIAGTVIWGAARDIDEAAAIGYPLFAHARFMRTGKGRARMVAVGQSVQLNGVTVHPGDWIIGDGDGVVRVPAEAWTRVAEQARAVQEAEDRILADVRAGMSLADARRRHRYDRMSPR